MITRFAARLNASPISGTVRVTAANVLIACGTRPAHSPAVPLDGDRILDSDQLLRGQTLPRDTIGRKVWEMYEARGFSYPGTPGSAPPPAGPWRPGPRRTGSGP